MYISANRPSLSSMVNAMTPGLITVLLALSRKIRSETRKLTFFDSRKGKMQNSIGILSSPKQSYRMSGGGWTHTVSSAGFMLHRKRLQCRNEKKRRKTRVSKTDQRLGVIEKAGSFVRLLLEEGNSLE